MASSSPCQNGACDKMMVETATATSVGPPVDNSNAEVTTTTVVNKNGDVMDAAERKKNPVGRRKLILSAREVRIKTIVRLD